MKKNSLLLFLAIQGLNTFAAEYPQTQMSSSISTQIQTQELPQVTSQAVVPSQSVVPTLSQEAIKACSGLYEKDSCQFHKNNALLNGTCKILSSGNNNYELGCQPEQSPKNAAIDSSKDIPHTKEQHKHKRS